MRPTALSQSIPWCPPHCRGTEQGALGQAHLSASCIPLTVTKPLTLYTPAHCNETPSESTVQLFIRENDCSSNVTGERTSSPPDNSLDHSVPSEFRVISISDERHTAMFGHL